MRPAPRIMALLFAFWPSAVMRSPPPHSVRAVRAIPRTGSMARATQASAKTVIASRPIFSSRMRLYPAQNAITLDDEEKLLDDLVPVIGRDQVGRDVVPAVEGDRQPIRVEGRHEAEQRSGLPGVT